MTVTSDPAAMRREEPAWPDEPSLATPTAAVAETRPAADTAGLPIGRLRRVDPVELWRSEDVATWLAGNLDEIAQLIGTPLTVASSAARAPGTVVATDPDGGQVLVVIELGASSDETFGTLMRRIVASGSRTAVWVCATASDEHLTSVEWLNREITGHLHVVLVEAVRIDDSVPAPIFRTASLPPSGSARPANGDPAPA